MSREFGSDLFEGILHEPTQVHEHGVDLSVSEVYTVEEPGRIDFGGGELEPAGLKPHERVWRDETDEYQWWELDAGQYLLEYNESLSEETPITCSPRDALLARGAFHPTVTRTAVPAMPLSVGGAGLKLKANARVSTAIPE